MSWYGTESYYCRIIICLHVSTKHYKSSLKRNIVKPTSWNIAVVVLDQWCIWTVCSMASTKELTAWTFSSGSCREISRKLSRSSTPFNKIHHRNIFGYTPFSLHRWFTTSHWQMALQNFLYLPTFPDHAEKQTANKIVYDTIDVHVILPFWQIARIKTLKI